MLVNDREVVLDDNGFAPRGTDVIHGVGVFAARAVGVFSSDNGHGPLDESFRQEGGRPDLMSSFKFHSRFCALAETEPNSSIFQWTTDPPLENYLDHIRDTIRSMLAGGGAEGEKFVAEIQAEVQRRADLNAAADEKEMTCEERRAVARAALAEATAVRNNVPLPDVAPPDDVTISKLPSDHEAESKVQCAAPSDDSAAVKQPSDRLPANDLMAATTEPSATPSDEYAYATDDEATANKRAREMPGSNRKDANRRKVPDDVVHTTEEEVA